MTHIFGFFRPKKRSVAEKFLNAGSKTVLMGPYNVRDLNDETGYRLRCMKGLIVQIREDHARCKQLWEKVLDGTNDNSEMEHFVRTFSWLRQEISVFLELRERCIEGIVWSELDDILEDVREKEEKLKFFF